MAKINPNFQLLRKEYIFPVIEQKVLELKNLFPGTSPINLGIGDIALPLAQSIVRAIQLATQEMGQKEGMRGYGPHNGYLFLRKAIADHEFSHLKITPDDIFVSDGANSDAVNLLELFSQDNVVGIMDPTYPAYLDASILAGKKKIVALPCLEENTFFPLPPQEHCDILYLCSPNNPTGVAMTRDQLSLWVNYALEHEAIIVFDHAYEAFITSADVPKSIFEIEGADRCAIELRSFSKTAGFTGLRCAYAVIPKNIRVSVDGTQASLSALWNRRQAAKSNGVAYPIQRGAEAVYTPVGRQETRAQVAAYLDRAKELRTGLIALGHTCYGGIDAPYIWWKTPRNLSSWEFFDLLLKECHLISIPGKGFGPTGEGYVRLSTFTTADVTAATLTQLKKL